MQEVETVGCRFRKQKESLERRRVRVLNSIDQTADEVHRVAEIDISLIRQHESAMTRELLKQKETFQAAFSAQITDLDEKLTKIDSSLEFGKDVLQRKNLPEIVNVEEILEQRFQDLLSSRHEFQNEINFSGARFVPDDTLSMKNALGKLFMTNTDPSLSFALGKGLTEGLEGEDCTFTIITNDSQGQTTYSEIDKVAVDIRSMKSGKITKPASITDLRNGRYVVEYKPEATGEFSVSITVAGETLEGSPFKLNVKERISKSQERKEVKRQSSDRVLELCSFAVQPQFMKILKRVYKTQLQEIEEHFCVCIVWDENTTQVSISPRKMSQEQNRFQGGCDAFIDLYQKVHPNLGREEVELPDGADEARIIKAVSLAEAEDPVIIEMVDKTLVVYAEMNSMRRSVQSLKEKLGLTNDGNSRKIKRGQGNKRRDARREENETSQQRLIEVLDNGVKLSLYQGDITDEPVDAIVNAANERLQHGAGVAAAIVRKGGRQIQDESDQLIKRQGLVDVGGATVTNGGCLACRYVIHTVGPEWKKHGKDRSKSLLRRACIESLRLAAVRLQLSSIALTAISSGIFGMPKDVCAQIMFSAVEEFSSSNDAEFSTLRDVRIVIIDKPTTTVFQGEFVKRYLSHEVSQETVTTQGRPSDDHVVTSTTSNTKHEVGKFKRNDSFASLDQTPGDRKPPDGQPKQNRAVPDEKNSGLRAEPELIKTVSLSNQDTEKSKSLRAEPELIKTVSLSNQDTEKSKKAGIPKSVMRQKIEGNEASHELKYNKGKENTGSKALFGLAIGGERSNLLPKFLISPGTIGGTHYVTTTTPPPGLAVTEEGKNLAKFLKKTNCSMCMNLNKDPLYATKCGRGHYYCNSCIKRFPEKTGMCPQCQKEDLSQDQPIGCMTWITVTQDSLQGYEDCDVIIMYFKFDGGIQGPEHPNPGQPYSASYTTAFLPSNSDGKEVCNLLKRAFDKRLLFTIGTSPTTGEENKIVWNGIELKTNQSGGPASYGYPDPSYLDRVKKQLAEKGITQLRG